MKKGGFKIQNGIRIKWGNGSLFVTEKKETESELTGGM
jgi:hypothetical protein